MTDQNQREWPSFTDILEELNTLGGLSSAPSPTSPIEPALATPADGVESESSEPEPAWSFDAGELFETDTAGDDTAGELPVDAPVSELPEGEDFGVSYEAPTPVADETPPIDEAPSFDPIVPESTSPTPIDWSDWDFQGGPADPGDGEAGGVFEVDTTDLESELDSADIVEFEVPGMASETAMAGSDGPIDSVATADEIEGDLQELFSMVEVDETEASQLEMDEQTEEPADATELASLDELAVDEDQGEPVDTDPAAGDLAAAVEALGNEVDQPDNVVPLRPDSLDYTDDVVGLDGAFDPARSQPIEPAAAAEFVGVEEDDTRGDDKWDYLRPGDDEGVAGSFWSKRPKLFGGDERKSKKAARRQAEEDEALSGPPCPKCGSPGHVDLDDPIGGKLHMSCHKCDHVWSQLAEARPESA